MHIDQVKMSEMLIVGFVKDWPMHKVVAVCGGVEGQAWKETDSIHEAAPFMPADSYQYNSPVRAYIAAEWPKLADWLCRHEREGAKALQVAPQVRRLVSKGRRHRHVVADAGYREIAASRREARNTLTANAAARKQQLSHQRGAWNVCKG